MTEKPVLYMIGGPTASGKTALALEIARRENGVVINADAMQVYSGLPLLTAQPTAAEKGDIPHRLFEIFDPAEKSSVGRWLLRANEAIAQAVGEGFTPILVGGTGLYFSSVLGRLAHIPDVPDAVRRAVEALFESDGHDVFRKRLAAKDPVSAEKIAPNDRQRLIRAYEVVHETGKPLSVWQEECQGKSLENFYQVERRLLMPDREELYAACDARFVKMVKSGALEEARNLKARKLDPELPAMKILGVRDLIAHLDGECSLEEAIARAQLATRHYAKRQMTWFRNQWD